MDKFIQYIKMYYLNGLVDRVTIKNENGTLTTFFSAQNKSVVGKIIGNNILPNIDDFEISLNNNVALIDGLELFKDLEFRILNSAKGTPNLIKLNETGKILPNAEIKLFAGDVKKPNQNTINSILACPVTYTFKVDETFRDEFKKGKKYLKSISEFVLNTNEHSIKLNNSTESKYQFGVDNLGNVGGYGDLKIPHKEFMELLGILPTEFEIKLHNQGGKKMFSIEETIGDYELIYFLPPLVN